MRKFICFILLFGLAGLTSCGNKDEKDVEKSTVDVSVEKFLSIQIDYYKNSNENDTKFNYNIVKALDLLNEHNEYNINDYASTNEVSTYIDSLISTASTTNYYKALIIADAFGVNINNSQIVINVSDLNTGGYGIYSYAYAYYCAKLTNNDDLKNELITTINSLTNTDLSYFDADSAVMYLGLPIENKQLFYNIVNNALSENGAFYNDWITGEPVYNASSTATIIFGLLQDGKNPYSYNEYNLVEQLLTFENNGLFKNTKNDEEIDYNFATPQGFLALVGSKYNQVIL